MTATVGEKLYVKTDSVFQYDYGLKLVIEGVTLPEEYDVHFSNTNSTYTKTVTGDSTGVAIPDEYLCKGEDVHAWLYMHVGEDDGETVYHIQIPVNDRPMRSEEDITPIEHRLIEEALEALENVHGLPDVTEDDNGKILMVVDGEWETVAMGVWQGGDY